MTTTVEIGMSIKRALSVLLTALVAVGLLAAPRAWALPQLSPDSSPAPNETLATSPTQLVLTFTTELATEPEVILLDAAGLTVPTQPAQRQATATQWIVPISSPLPAGTYRVKWSVEAVLDEYTFNVGQASAAPAQTPPSDLGAATTVAGAPAPAETVTPAAGDPAASDPAAGAPATTANPSSATSKSPDNGSGVVGLLAILARWASTLGLACVFGGLAVVALAWPEGVEYVITSRYLRTVWLIALGATLILMITTRARESGTSIASSISPMALLDLRNLPGGSALLLRFVFIAASGWVVLVPERVVDASTQIPAFAAPALALLTFGFSRSGDAAGGVLGIGAAIIHAFSFSVWLGGVALLARVVVIGPGDEDLLHAVRGFSRLAGPALIGVVVSGVIRTAQLAGGGSSLFNTGYGRLLLVKAIGVAVLAYVATVNRQTVRGKLDRSVQLSGRAAGRLRRAFSAEFLAGVVVMGLAAWMLNSVPPGAANALSANKVKPVAEVALKDSGIDVSVGAAPAAVGANTIVITIRKPVTGLVDMDVQLLSPAPQGGGIDIPKVAAVLKGKGSMRVEGVPLDTPGLWTVVVTARDTDGPLPIVTGTLEIGSIDTASGGDDPTATTQPAAATPVTSGPAAGLVQPAASPNAATTSVP